MPRSSNALMPSRALMPPCTHWRENDWSGSKKKPRVASTSRAVEYVTAYMRLDDNEQAFAWLARAVEERNRLAFEIKINPVLDPLRSDPRFEKIVASLAPKE